MKNQMAFKILVTFLTLSFLLGCSNENDSSDKKNGITAAEQKYPNLSATDRLDIIGVMSTYGMAADTRDYELFRSLFHSEVEATFVFEPSFFDGDEVKVSGVDDLIDYIKASSTAFKVGGQHSITNPIISVEEGLIKVRCNVTWRAYYIDPPDRSISLWGYYETHMERIGGRWLIIKHSLFSLGSR